MANIVKIENVNANALEFSPPRQNKSSPGKTVYVTLDGKPLRVQTPKLKCPFGVSVVKDKNTGKILKYQLELSFEGAPEAQARFTEIEAKLLEFATANAGSVLGLLPEEQIPAVVKAFFKTNIFPSPFHGRPDPKYEGYPLRFKAKLNLDEAGYFTADMFTGTKPYTEFKMNTVNHLELFPKGSQARAIMSCCGWIVDKKFGLTWRLEQVQTFPNITKLVGFSFMDVDDPADGGDSEGVEGGAPVAIPQATIQSGMSLGDFDDGLSDHERQERLGGGYGYDKDADVEYE